MVKRSFSSEKETHQTGVEGEDSTSSLDLELSLSVLGVTREEKQRPEALELKPVAMENIKAKAIKLFGVEIHADGSDVHNPRPLRCFDPNTRQFVPVDHLPGLRGRHMDAVPEPEPVSEPQPQPQPQPQPDDFARLLQNIEGQTGARPVLVYQKSLTNSDLSPNLNRLLITRSQALMGIMRDDERARVQHVDNTIGLEVPTIDRAGESYRLRIKRWGSMNVVVLNGKHWNKVVSRNRLVAGQVVQLYAYREEADAVLCLAINFQDAQ